MNRQKKSGINEGQIIFMDICSSPAIYFKVNWQENLSSKLITGPSSSHVDSCELDVPH